MYRVIFNCPAFHHINHVMPVIKRLKQTNNYKIYIVSKEDLTLDGVKVYSHLKLLPPRLYDAYISTEMHNPPFWVRRKKIFLGHGVGPKMRYQRNPKIAEFDYSFAPCNVFAKAHAEMGLQVVESGLPILDNLKVEASGKEEVFSKLGLNNSKMLVNYIPSWSNDINLLQNIQPIIEKISKWVDYNIVISPHPNLLKPERCEGLVFFENLPENIVLNTTISTLDITNVSDFVVGDISSSMFEGMALGKIVIWDGDESNYILNQAEFMLPALRKTCPTVDSINDPQDSASFREIQKEYIESYMFNIGNSTNCILAEIRKIVEA